MLITVVAIVAIVVLVVGVVAMRRAPRQDEGMQNFRRHIDALSPEARREVHDRARRNDQGRR
jgi:hypothetical protein